MTEDPGRQPHFTDLFGHDERALRAVAFDRGGRWELAVLDEAGEELTTWRPDPALFRRTPPRTIPTLLRMLVVMVRSGTLPLRPLLHRA